MNREAANTIILYSDSGFGKSENAAQFAKLAYEVTGKPIRLIAQEVSSELIFRSLVEVGVVQPCYLMGMANPLAAMRKLSQGQWPAADGKSWQLWDGKAGAYIIEGLTSISERLLEDVRTKQRAVGQDVVGKFEEDGEKFAKAGQSHFGFVQDEMLANLQRFGGLDVWRVLWTAHEAKGEDEDSKAAIRGPGLVGKAKTDVVKKYCSVLLHMEGYPETLAEQGQLARTIIKRRVWFTPHPDSNFKTITYHAKVTVPSENLPELMSKYPSGYFEPVVGKEGGLQNSLADFIKMESGLAGRSLDQTKVWKEKVDARRKEVVNA